MLRACLVCLPAASVVNPALGGGIGGTETRAWLFARMLARRGDTAVTFVVRHREPMDGVVDGVTIRTHVDRVFNLYEQVGMCVTRRAGFPWITIRQWRWPLLWQLPKAIAVRLLKSKPDPTQPAAVFRDIDCDVFCTFGVQTTSATVIASAHAAGKSAVLVLGSDGDLDPKFLGDPDYVNPYGDRASVCRFILDQADVIVCQTVEQQRVLKERFGRNGVVIENPIDLEEFDRRVAAERGEGTFGRAEWLGQETQPQLQETRPKLQVATGASRSVLWVGRAESIHKRPMLAVEIAERCREIPFLLVMNPRDPAEGARVRAAAPPNVTIRDQVPPPEMPALMASSLALLNTSSLEGFPNTFLQAGAARVPVVSLVVGESYIDASGAGICCQGDIDRAADALRAFNSDESRRHETGTRGRQYVEQHHAAAARTAELHDVLLSSGF
ncbi:MAG TPA: glycosyltransferase family 4 protein [Caulifigura sp.]|nr:glycosyltransferase family 4 protein [Caulifigura sp.]